jgi:hypothetical protein
MVDFHFFLTSCMQVHRIYRRTPADG